MTDFENGPLPEHLESSAYFTAGRREWALPKAAALEYLDWCEARGLGVHGFDVWYPTKPGPTVTDEGLGNVEGVAAAREGIRQHPGEYASGQVVFNIWVVGRGPIPAAGQQAAAADERRVRRGRVSIECAARG